MNAMKPIIMIGVVVALLALPMAARGDDGKESAQPAWTSFGTLVDRMAIEEHERAAAKTDIRGKAHTLPQQLQTDRAMEQSSKALHGALEGARNRREKEK